MGNPFVESKSATKFMQGGIVGIPTIATPTQPFIECIQNGLNGYLASSAKEWKDSLISLKNLETRMNMGELARRDTLEKHCVGSLLDDVEKLVNSSRENVRKNLQKKFSSRRTQSNVVWLLPSFIPGSGGHRNVFRIANLIEGSEFHAQIFFHEDSRDTSTLSKLVREHYGDFKFEVISNRAKMREADFVVGVHNSSIPFAKQNAGKQSILVYLVQDYEPWFTPMGVHSLDALSTYFDSDFNIITSGAWMSRKIQEIRGFTPPFFNFPVDTAIYKPKQELNRAGVVFFAKSDTPRRLFEVGIEILNKLNLQDPSLPITIFGSNQNSHLPFKHRNVQLVPTLQELAEIYSSHRLGIAFSPTNPSLVPYEMMACGLPVLDIDLPGSPMEKYGNNELLKPPIYGRDNLLSRAIKLLGDDDYWKSTSAAGLDFIKTMPSPMQASQEVLVFLRKLRDTKNHAQ
jgi:glycosyltransferase involved in cell wall biosynthesis